MRKERFPPPQANLSLKQQDRSRLKTHDNLPDGGPSQELKQKADCGLVQSKSSGNCERPSIKGKAMKNDELIKYMSDVPGYLQRVETGENLQEKALNFGVLDWSCLEKFNHKQETAPSKSTASSSSAGFPRKTSTGSFSSSGADHSQAPAQRVKQSRPKVMRFQDFRGASKSSLEGQKKTPWTYKSFGENCLDEKSKRRGLDQKMSSGIRNLSPNLRNQEMPCRIEKSVRPQNGKAKRVGGLQKEEVKTSYLDEKVTKELLASSSNLRIYGSSLSPEEKNSAETGGTKMRRQESKESAIDLAHQCFPEEPNNVVLLSPKKYPQNSLSAVFQLSENITSTDGELTEADANDFSSGFFPGNVLSSQVPHSCPLPSRVETTTSRPDILPYSQINVQDMEHPSGAFRVPQMFIQGKYAEKNKSIHKDSNLAANPKMVDQAANEGVEREDRSTTPNRRFRFGLGRLSRSSSLKESSAVPQLSSIHLSAKSDPVRSEASACLDSLNKDKGNLHSKARSSPFRRLLDPLLKSKVKTAFRSAESTVSSPKLSLNSSSFRSSNASESASEFLVSEKPVASTIQAFLQLTVKNGLPLYRFVADNNCVLAATMRNFATPEKDSTSENFTFYSVNEIKKRSGGWMNQGSKGKKSEFVYDVVGQMKVSSPHSSVPRGQNSNQYMIRESVLFGVEVQQEELDSTKCATHRELAAVVVKFASEILSHGTEKNQKDNDAMEKDSKEWFQEHRYSFNSEDNEEPASIIGILPGGLHSLPEKGLPSSLVDRWRSGGLCDCGGWDMGCSLHVLSNYDQYNKFSRIPQNCPIPERFQLFVQERDQQDWPIFSLAPVKNDGYSIAFSSSISLLQAFFIGVAVLNCQKFPDHMKDLQEHSLDGNKTLHGVYNEVPARYMPDPPHSPVGRV